MINTDPLDNEELNQFAIFIKIFLRLSNIFRLIIIRKQFITLLFTDNQSEKLHKEPREKNVQKKKYLRASTVHLTRARQSDDSSRVSRDNTTFRVLSLHVPPASVLYCYDKGWINIPVHVRGFCALIPGAHLRRPRVVFFLMSSDDT